MTPEAIHDLNAWLIILPAVAVGYTLGRVRPLRGIVRRIKEWTNLNDILASAERLARRDRTKVQHPLPVMPYDNRGEYRMGRQQAERIAR